MEALSRKGKPWTDEELETLAEDRRNKVPAAVTAAKLGRPVHSVRGIGLTRTGILVQVHRPSSPEDDAEITRLFNEGFTDAQIAEQTGRTIGSVRYRLQELELKRPEAEPRQKPATKPRRERKAAEPRQLTRPRFSDADIAFIKENAGKLDAAEMAAALGRSIHAVHSKASAEKVSLAIKRSKITLEQLEDALKVTSDSKELARMLDVHPATVNRVLREHGKVPERRRRVFDHAARQKIVELAATMSPTQVAKATGWDFRTVKRVGDEEGLVFASPVRAARPMAPKKPQPKPERAPRRVVAKPRRVDLDRQADAILKAARTKPAPVVRQPPAAAPNTVAAAKPERPAAKPALRPERPKTVARRPLPAPVAKGGNEKTLSMIAMIAQRMRKDGRLPRR